MPPMRRMKKYATTSYKTVTTHREIEVEAETPQEAAKLFQEKLEDGFTFNSLSEMVPDPEDPAEEVESECYEVVAHCDGCDAPILTGENYFIWADASTCLDCGGANETHEPVTA